jgi:hypothetical protein
VDQEILVREQIDGAGKLIDRLAGAGFDLTAAFWAKTDEDDQWYLYLASPVVDREGPQGGYAAVRRALSALGGQWDEPSQAIDPYSVKVLETNHPLTQSVLDVQGRHPGPVNMWYRVRYLRGYSIEGAYIYALPRPAPTA